LTLTGIAAGSVDKLFTMDLAAPLFYNSVGTFTTLAILIVFIVIEIVALVNCLTQRADAFPVVGSLSKNAWVSILAGSLLLSLICAYFTSDRSTTPSIFSLIAITATAIYMLDVRPALRDAASGSGSW
jgi:hypothetical protein